MKITLKAWRESPGKISGGHFEEYAADNLSPDMSFLEMLDTVNERLTETGQEPIAFDHDCREGICGTCSAVINGIPHGPDRGVATCQVYMRRFKDGETITVEPFRSTAFPIVKDLIVDRSAFDRIQQAGGYISVNTGSAPDANALPVGKSASDEAFDAAACIGCGACVAACKNGSAMLFTAAKVSHLALLPQGQAERDRRVLRMVETMDAEGFGGCTNQYECEAVCPKGISVTHIARMNRDYLMASLRRTVA
ncbi:MAG: succinate dehydrogenase/fumarate reductase iron-sulfur subunit [Candidatus Methylacidiphilales bacterium]